jgi:hypothetical protein
MQRTLLALILAAFLVAGCAEEPALESGPLTSVAKPKATIAPAPKPTEPSRPGDPAVYARIAKMTDCATLQEQFDIAEQTSQRPGGPQGATWSEIGIAYMQAADERMREVDCYK